MHIVYSVYQFLGELKGGGAWSAPPPLGIKNSGVMRGLRANITGSGSGLVGPSIANAFFLYLIFRTSVWLFSLHSFISYLYHFASKNYINSIRTWNFLTFPSFWLRILLWNLFSSKCFCLNPLTAIWGQKYFVIFCFN